MAHRNSTHIRITFVSAAMLFVSAAAPAFAGPEQFISKTGAQQLQQVGKSSSVELTAKKSTPVRAH